MTDLNLLFENKKDHIMVDDLLTEKQISTFLETINHQPEWKKAEYAKIHEHLFEGKTIPKHLFSSQYMVVSNDCNEDKYLALCKNYQDVWKKITTECGFDPFLIFKNYMKNFYQIDIQLASKNHSTYCPVVVRDLSEEVLPHADYGPYDGKGWIIEQVTHQIAWNLYLTHPGEGGETIVYDYVWENDLPMDENSYGIKDLNKPIKIQFSVKSGRLVLFNSRNFHAVRKSSNPRIAIGGLLGKTKEGKFIAWS